MSKVILGLLFLMFLVLFVLLFWIILLTVALLVFPRGGKREKIQPVIKKQPPPL